MSRLDEVRKNITEMSEDELREHIRQIRADRKISKTRTVIKKARAKSSDKAKGKVKNALDGMTQAQLMALLGELEESGNGTEGS